MTQNNVYWYPLVTGFHLIPIMPMFRSRKNGLYFGLHDLTNAPDLRGAWKWPLTMFINIALSQAFIWYPSCPYAERRKNDLHSGLPSGRHFSFRDFFIALDLHNASKGPKLPIFSSPFRKLSFDTHHAYDPTARKMVSIFSLHVFFMFMASI